MSLGDTDKNRVCFTSNLLRRFGEEQSPKLLEILWFPQVGGDEKNHCECLKFWVSHPKEISGNE